MAEIIEFIKEDMLPEDIVKEVTDYIHKSIPCRIQLKTNEDYNRKVLLYVENDRDWLIVVQTLLSEHIDQFSSDKPVGWIEDFEKVIFGVES